MADEKVCYAQLRPEAFRQRLQQRPVAYLPLGTLEWHGEHLPLGSDAIQSEALMIACARRFGGIVLPPIHLGPDRCHRQPDGSILVGMDTADSTTPHRQLDGSCYWLPDGQFAILIDAILAQVKRAGFQVVFADGHGPSRNAWVKAIPGREARFGLRLLGVTDAVRDAGWLSQMDHAARNETSLMLHHRPELVDLDQLPEDSAVWPQGVGGKDPRTASADYGRECLEASVRLVGQLLAETGV